MAVLPVPVDRADGLLVVGADGVQGHRRTLPVGAEAAGFDDDDLHSERCDLAGEHFGESFHREFGGLVRAHSRCAADPSADRGELDEYSGPLGAQHRQRGAGDVDDAEQIGLDLGAEILLGHLFDRCAVGVTGVVDHDVEVAERVDRLLNRVFGGGRIGDVQRHGPDPLAVGGRQIVELLGSACGGDDLVSCREDRFGEVTAEAARCSGDQPCSGHERFLRSDSLSASGDGVCPYALTVTST